MKGKGGLSSQEHNEGVFFEQESTPVNISGIAGSEIVVLDLRGKEYT